MKKGFENVDKTKEYRERNYWEENNNKSIEIELNQFWAEWSDHVFSTKKLEGFVTKNFL